MNPNYVTKVPVGNEYFDKNIANFKSYNLKAIDLHEFIETDLPTRDPILSPWLLNQSLVMIHSWRGIRKTHVALGIAYAVASGGSFLGWEADEPKKVLLLDGEMPGRRAA